MRLHAFTILAAVAATAACRTSSVQNESASEVLGDGDPGEAVAAEELPGATYGAKLRYKEYTVLFTNPVCKDYPYAPDQNVISTSGKKLTQKPKNTFCSRADKAASANRPEAPQKKLIDWINDPATKEIFFAYLSFSNSDVMRAVCAAVQERGAKVTFIIDKSSETSVADQLLACKPNPGVAGEPPRMLQLGHDGGIGYAHNKLFLINPDQGQMRFAFSSGNMSSGIVLHHENWHFVVPENNTYFAQLHAKCLRGGLLDPTASKSTANYSSYIKNCRKQLNAQGLQEESDVKAFFVPGEGARATQFLKTGIKNSSEIWLAAHRFGYNRLISDLRYAMSSSNPPELRMVFDDDTWWAGHGDQTGDNETWEYDNAMDLQSLGAKVKWMETNHAGHLLHHNKYLVFKMRQEGPGRANGVFCGAGNLTGTAFTSNFENFYYVEIPEVFAAYRKQYDYKWNKLATAAEDLPKDNVLPPGAE